MHRISMESSLCCIETVVSLFLHKVCAFNLRGSTYIRGRLTFEVDLHSRSTYIRRSTYSGKIR